MQELASVHTASMPELLDQLGASLLVTTYQAGKVILVRCDRDATDGPVLNTHFQEFDKPMGVCARDHRLAIGGAHAIWEYRNVPAAASQLDPPGRHDTCYVPRSVHFTGDIDVHEVNWSNQGELWLVNTRFSCLCTVDADNSFYPRWRPPFVSALAPEDRCHLNGLAMRDGRPRYVTALGETDTRAGWRADKVTGGILIDTEDAGATVRGLSMPHSPRWYRDRLWVLESGRGSLATVDLTSGAVRSRASLPGFTRGLDFLGRFAFVGLSKVRETAVFSGLPITRAHTDRQCGIWVVDIEAGATVGFLRFESGVEEIFGVQVLPRARFPELLPGDSRLVRKTYVLPDQVLAEVTVPSREDIERAPDGIMAQAAEHFRGGEFEQAAAAFRACLDIQNDYPDAGYGLGIALAELGRWPEALGYLESSVAHEPDRADIQTSLGSLLQRMGAFDRAMSAFDEAVARQPEDAVAHLCRAELLLKLGAYRRGFEEFEWRRRGLVPTLNSPHPDWDGRAAPGQVLLIYLEHEDARRLIVLMRLIPLAAARVASAK